MRSAILLTVLMTVQVFVAGSLERTRREAGWEIRVEGESLDPVELIGARVLSSFRGLFVDALWIRSQSRELRDNIEELPVIYDLITSLQPNFVESSSFCAMNLAMDVSVTFGEASEQWYWIREGLRVFDKAIRRNANHPRIWRLYRDRAYVVSQKCLPSSKFSPFRDEFRRMYVEEFGEDPHDAAIRDFQRLLDHDGVPGGWLFTYSRTWENWAANSDDPAVQLDCVIKARDAWRETLQKVPEMIDEGNSEHLEAKIRMCRAHQAWVGGDRTAMSVWMTEAAAMVEENYRDPLVRRQTWRIVGPKGRNLWVDLLLDKARGAMGRARWNEALEIVDHLSAEHSYENLPGWDPSESDRLRIVAESTDWIRGSILHSISTIDDEERARALKNTADSYKKRALSAYKRLLLFDPDNESVKEKVRNLERE